MPDLPKRILFIRLSAMGDVAMCIHILIALQRSYPQVQMIVVSRERFKPLFNALPNVIFIAAQPSGKHKGVSGLYRLSGEIKKIKIDAIVDWHNVLRSKILKSFFLKTLKVTLDKGRLDKKRLISDANFFKQLPHTTDRYLNAVNRLGFNLVLKNDEFLPAAQLSNDLIKLLGEKTSKWIGVAPFAAHETKSLTVKRAREIVTRLSELKDVEVLLFGGGAAEVKKLELVAGTAPQVRVVAGKLSFEQELILISNLDLMIAMDSGNGHLAALYHIPVITLWGNTHPYAGFTPYAQPNDNQLTVDRDDYPLVPTSIFGNLMIEGYVHITNSIAIESVIHRTKQILAIE